MLVDYYYKHSMGLQVVVPAWELPRWGSLQQHSTEHVHCHIKRVLWDPVSKGLVLTGACFGLNLEALKCV